MVWIEQISQTDSQSMFLYKFSNENIYHTVYGTFSIMDLSGPCKQQLSTLSDYQNIQSQVI